jgi:hypothetical protein
MSENVFMRIFAEIDEAKEIEFLLKRVLEE